MFHKIAREKENISQEIASQGIDVRSVIKIFLYTPFSRRFVRVIARS